MLERQLAPGTIARLQAVLRKGERQADFIAQAIEEAIERREAKKLPRRPKSKL
jgi:hypothetical protein